ncbi:CHC2 zinc finger domain-containing protein [Salinimicrobium sp. GXAS 041]|uniref:CHC2 zinc finger domain-containing protein n=1 Tax=Salinimicrobium sp. GXAS 041 TaxID=3400806 RepID=UPI003C755FED
MKKHQLSWRNARNVCIVKTLATLGHYPTRKSEKEAWFLSPLRSETQASFNVSLIKNLWFDFGQGKGGNVIDLIMQLKNSSFEEALEFLSTDTLPIFDCPNPKVIQARKEGIVVIEVNFITHPALKEYLDSRGIPFPVARQHCREVRYRLKSKAYFAIGLLNYLGGWELRNKYLKNSSSPKSFSYLQRNHHTLLITEGMFDFLSLSVMEEYLVNSSDVIILNSLGFVHKIPEHISPYENIRLYLDNDPAGNKATDLLLNLFDRPQMNVVSTKDLKI